MEYEYVDALKYDDNKRIKELYELYRDEFFVFTKKYQLEESDCADIYQESFLGIRKHAISGKLYGVNSSFKTYLFAIAKHLISDKIKDNSYKKPYNPELHNSEIDYETIIIDQTKELTKQQQLLRHHFNNLGKSCQQMLTLSFYRGLTNEEIANQYGYESEAVVRSQKSRCLKTLKDLIKTSPK